MSFLTVEVEYDREAGVMTMVQGDQRIRIPQVAIKAMLAPMSLHAEDPGEGMNAIMIQEWDCRAGDWGPLGRVVAIVINGIPYILPVEDFIQHFLQLAGVMMEEVRSENIEELMAKRRENVKAKERPN